MRRRTVLASSGGCLVPLLGGCFSPTSVLEDSPSLPAEMSVREEHVVHDVLPDSRDRWDAVTSGEAVHRTFTERDNATESITPVRVPASFLDETDFDESFVVVVQYGRQSATWLELNRIERTDDGLDIVVGVEEPSGGYGDDLAIHSLLLRITDRRAGVPDTIDVTIDDL